MFQIIMKGQHGVRTVSGQEIYDFYYTGVFEIYLHLSVRLLVPVHAPIPFACTGSRVLITDLYTFATNSRMIDILGVIYIMK